MYILTSLLQIYSENVISRATCKMFLMVVGDNILALQSWRGGVLFGSSCGFVWRGKFRKTEAKEN